MSSEDPKWDGTFSPPSVSEHLEPTTVGEITFGPHHTLLPLHKSGTVLHKWLLKGTVLHKSPLQGTVLLYSLLNGTVLQIYLLKGTVLLESLLKGTVLHKISTKRDSSAQFSLKGTVLHKSPQMGQFYTNLY